jgi:Ca-activated chloride channel family protein
MVFGSRIYFAVIGVANARAQKPLDGKNEIVKMKYWKAYTLLALLFSSALAAQPYQKGVKEGNRAFELKAYDEAEVNYKKATTENPEGFAGWFNLGDALYKQERYDEALKAYQKGAELSPDMKKAAATMHNIGNSFAAQDKYQQAVEAYKAALRMNPEDDETRYNLAKALRELKQQQQQQNQDQNQKKQDQKKDQEKQDKPEARSAEGQTGGARRPENRSG